MLCIGRLYCDIVFTDLPRMPTPGTEVFSGGVGLHAGGGAAITAGHLAALSHPTALLAHLPPAPFGDIIKSELNGLGVDLGQCQTQADQSAPQLTVALVHGGERAFVTHRAGAAFPAISEEDMHQPRTSHIHVGEASTLVDHPELVTIAKASGATLSLDCSWDDNLDADVLANLLPQVDVFLPNAAEVALLKDMGLSAPFSNLTVVKQGKDGARAVTNGSEIHAPAKAVDIVDTTGAGDAFNAGFLSNWLRGAPLEECLAGGNAMGAQAVRYSGGLGGLSSSVEATQDR